MSNRTPTRVLVLGGGFGGIATALRLQTLLGERDLQLTLVNRDNYFLFTPMLHEVAASELEATHIVNPLRKLLRRGVLFTGEVERIDLAARRVTVAHADGGHRHELLFDHLVLALGSVTNFFGLPGVAERAITMRTLGDAITLRNRLLRLLEEADFECAAGSRHGLLSIVVVGGGFAGVETVAAVNDFLRHALRFYPHMGPQDLHVVLVHAGSTLLPELDARLGRFTARELAARGVDVRLGTTVVGVSDSQVTLSDGTAVEARTLVWTAGNGPNPILKDLPCPRRNGRIAVDAHLEVEEWPGVWAIGDCASIPNVAAPDTFHPPTAQHALREGRTAAENIAARVAGRPPRPFTFSTIGQLAAVGRRSGVASILGRNFSGFVAWWLWRTIYLSKLPRLERKIRVALDWTLDLVFSRDLVQLPTARERAPEPAEAEAEVSAASH